MRIKTSTMSILALLSPAVLADFSLYAAGIGGNGISGNSKGWQVYPITDGAIECDQALDWIWRASKDVSGGKYGVRCVGDGHACDRSGSGGQIAELEFNTMQSGKDTSRPHFTFYANRGGAIVSTNGEQIGTCKPTSDQEFSCGISGGRAEGTRKLDCTSNLVAGDFKQLK